LSYFVAQVRKRRPFDQTTLTDIAIPFSGSIKLRNCLDVESVSEFFPDLRTEPISKHEADVMAGIGDTRRLSQQVSTDFPNVLSSLFIKITKNQLRFTSVKELNCIEDGNGGCEAVAIIQRIRI